MSDEIEQLKIQMEQLFNPRIYSLEHIKIIFDSCDFVESYNIDDNYSGVVNIEIIVNEKYVMNVLTGNIFQNKIKKIMPYGIIANINIKTNF